MMNVAANLAAIDLNLLVALDALLTDGHVGRAAMRIGLSQPATSHALKRLRELLDDPLLVRVRGNMELTPRAIALRAPLAETLSRVRDLLESKPFEPATSTRRFNLMMPDHVTDLLVPRLLARSATEAPGVRFDVAPWRGPAVMTPEHARAIDLVIACTSEAFPGFDQQQLFSDTEALAVREGHPDRARLKRLPHFLRARHVAVVGRGQREDPIDIWLREKNLSRHIGLVVPSYLQALHIAAQSDLVAFVPRRLIEAMSRSLGLRAITSPIDPGHYEEFVFHPTRAQADPGSVWLLHQVLDAGRTLDRARRAS